MRTPLRSLALLAAAALPLAAQGISDASVIAGPQYVSYTFGTGAAAKTVNQLSVPFAVIIPLGDRFTFDVSSSYANSQVRAGGATTSSINGLTDTQVRGNLMVGDNRAVFTIGVNLPTGQYTVPTAQQDAAGQIGNDFLVYPVSGMGNGLGATGGVAIAQSLGGDWNLGLGASFRHSTQFDAYQLTTGVLRFTPGDEFRLRVGLDRPVGDGRFSLGVTYSKFSKDALDSTTFATGDRALGQLNYSVPAGNGDFQVSVWNLYRGPGQQFGGAAPWENVANLNVALGFNAGDLYVQPSVEGRSWMVDGNKAGALGTVGLRFRFAMGALSVNPSGQYTIGKLYTTGTTVTTDVTGFRAGILIRLQ
jgi:hypothetical protein